MKPLIIVALVLSCFGAAAQDTLPRIDTSRALPDTADLENVTIVAATRSGDPVETATTKVEVLGSEELKEEATLKPGNIASILGDLSGIQIQQSSVTSGNANVRIQGLEGKYTQILRDGMPLYEGYSGGFGILTIPPLDLQQIELIKGSASTLYGGGAIGGLINLVSRKPTYQPDASFIINQSTLKETNLNAYYAQRNRRFGLTVFAGQNIQKAVDVDKDGLSDVASNNATLLHPTLFFYPGNNTTISAGWSGSFEKRKGGDMLVLDGKTGGVHQYFENNDMNRNTFLFNMNTRFSTAWTGTLKGSFSRFKRLQRLPGYSYDASQDNYYSEASANYRKGEQNLVLGVNFTGDAFRPESGKNPGSFENQTIGVFGQDTWTFSRATKLELGLRYDHHFTYGDFLLPRLALFHHFNDRWGMRAGFGMGYKTPNPLTPQLIDIPIDQIYFDPSKVKAEKAYGANLEVNYKHDFDEHSGVFINHAFFLTRVDKPIFFFQDFGLYSPRNSNGFLYTRGFDTYVQAHFNELELYLGYTYTLATSGSGTSMPLLYTPRNRAATVVAYTLEGWRFGVEGSYTGRQPSGYGMGYTRDYFFAAASVQHDFAPKFTVVLNGENLFDVRQSKYEPVYSGSITNPNYKVLWAPIDGRVINLSVRVRPFAAKN